MARHLLTILGVLLFATRAYALNPLTDLTATPTACSSILLTWTDTNTDETGTRIQRSLSASSGFVQIGTVSANISTFNDTYSLACGTTYYYRVYPVIGKVTGPIATVNTTTAAATATPTPTNTPVPPTPTNTPTDTPTPPDTPTNTPTPTSTPTAYSTSVLIADTNDTNLATGATNYIGISGSDNPNATETKVDNTVGKAIAVENMYCFVHTAPGLGNSWLLTLRKNAGDTALTCTISGTDTFCQDTTHLVAVAVGDLLSYSSVPTGPPTAAPLHCSVSVRSTP